MIEELVQHASGGMTGLQGDLMVVVGALIVASLIIWGVGVLLEGLGVRLSDGDEDDD